MENVACLGGRGAQFLFFRVALEFSLSIFFFAPSFLPSCLWGGGNGSLSVCAHQQEVMSPSEAGCWPEGPEWRPCHLLFPLSYFKK